MTVRDGKLRIDGLRQAAPVARQLLAHAADVKHAMARRDNPRRPVDESIGEIGCPFSRPLVRGPDLCPTFVAVAAIPDLATEYHLTGNLWLSIPRHWRGTST